jgi:hypothetical protein
MCSVDLNSGTKHMKTIFSFWPGSGKRFNGKRTLQLLTTVIQLIHILQFLTTNVF